MTFPSLNNPHLLNLDNCAKEPIHKIGKTQTHGVLISCDPKSLKITQVGRSTSRLFGMAFDEILGNDLSILLGEKQVKDLVELLILPFEGIITISIYCMVPQKQSPLHGSNIHTVLLGRYG
jgi:light-regulated signal transduction histidine kinase (bacteriophytochrome)